jgi:predicted regulator of Ras-like GTPase activity (Roadblock/LC7/MglB family)
VNDLARASARNFAWLIKGFVDRVPGADHALVLSSDGFPLIASDSLSGARAEQLAAVASAMLNLAGNTASLLDRGHCEQIAIRLAQGYLLIMAVGPGAGLCVLTSAGCDMKVVGYEMTQFVDRAGHALTPQLRADLRRVVTGRHVGGA